ncbi:MULTISPECIES: hypothetical protein [Vibrio]|uniref:hypothetical protein n=1 Tax=Vibrio TaxID=662 RepID=UPI001F0D30F2|nr:MULTISPECIES: hypothetical protein [Vibrio]
MSISPLQPPGIQQHNQWDLIMLQGNNNLSGALRLSDIIHQPADQVIEYLKDKPDFFGEAIAKACYQEITRQGGGAHAYQ